MRSRAVRKLRTLVVFTVLTVVAYASAAASLKLGVALPEWSELRSGYLHGAASHLIADYADQARHFCVAPEVFRQQAATSLPAARASFEASLPVLSSERLLVAASDQRVSLVRLPGASTDVMVVLAITASGAVLIVC